MSNEVTETDLNLDLHFLPAWAQQSPEINRYANYEGEREDRRSGWGKGPRRDRPFGDRPNRDRPQGDRARGPRPGGDRPPRGRFGKPGREPRGDDRRPFEKRPELPPLDLDIHIVPESKGVDSLTRQIRVTGRAYPLFDVARLVLQKDERFDVEFRVKKAPDGKVLQPLFVCVLDDSLWLNEEEAVNHVLEKHLATFYQVEKTPTDPPKGTYTFVAQCGLSGVVLGPPNYHDYQNKLHKLHQERFANMPFERFKSRVKIVRDEEVVKKWLEEQSFKTEYVVLNVPEPLRLGSWNDVQEHFRAIHLPNIVKTVDRQLVPGVKARRAGHRELQRHVAHEVDQQRRFPLKVVTTLSQQFATRGLQFFKVNKTIVHVSVARPHFLDIESEPVSDGVKKIVQHINQHPRCTVKDLVDALAPTAAQVPAPPPAAAAPADGQPAAQPTPTHHEATPAQKAVLADLHWLVHSGHVIEFANGELETAKKPLPKPPPPAPKKKEAPKPPAPESAATTARGSGAAPAEAVVTTDTGTPAAVAEPTVATTGSGEPAAEVQPPAEPAAGDASRTEPGLPG